MPSSTTVLEAETHLVLRLYARDEAAMTTFYDRYGVSLYRAIRLLMPTDQAAEDVLQESLVKIWLAFAHYNAERGRLYTWAVNICRHQALDHLRGARVRGAGRTVSLLDAPSAGQQLAPAFVPEHVDVRTSLQWLRPAYRLVVHLQYFDGFTQAEIAKRLNLPLGTVRTHSRQALRQLARLYSSGSAVSMVSGR
ncbi:RNA polymerase sigma factor [uncultured Hymenobacter sp.]|uniref:RNA polymerase sigma factor n=1 Tax=uncultured Hymenobacter sp. TaxID=170016 RepID=UPI0035C94D8F